jgi:hypothetical protein
MPQKWTGILRPDSAASPYRAVVIKPVSANRLSKTGIFAVRAGDFWEILAKVADLGFAETAGIRKNPCTLQGFRA